MNARISLTQEQQDALQQYANAHGRGWKSRLNADWARGGSNWPGPYHLLHRVRNSHGPSWLHSGCEIKPQAR